ncbi:ThrRS/AlaRS common domain-containing protein, partial [Rhodotorula sp. JG-1b]
MPTQSQASTSAAAALAARLDATPPHHYAHVTFPLPDKRYVGMLHCQRDPLAAALVTRVVRCDKVDNSKNSSGASKAKTKKGSAAPPSEQDVSVDDEWQIELADTVLFPEGGGQPSDTGRIVPLLPDGQQEDSSAPAAAVVRQVIRRNLDAVHFVSKPFEVGAQVRLEVDMDRRRDLMDQHTGQHLLSAVLEHEYQADTLSWSLQKYPELNYVELPRNLTPEEIAAVQRRCNDLIDEARPIRVKFELATEETGVQLGEHVPSDYKAGEHGDERPPVQRTVIIDQLDENPCCGTHYPSLSYLRTLYISPNTTSIRGTNTRLYFAVGSSRVLAYLASVQSPARQAALHAGCAVADLPNKVEGLVSAGTDLRRREKRLQAELAQWVAKDL